MKTKTINCTSPELHCYFVCLSNILITFTHFIIKILKINTTRKETCDHALSLSRKSRFSYGIFIYLLAFAFPRNHRKSAIYCFDCRDLTERLLTIRAGQWQWQKSDTDRDSLCELLNKKSGQLTIADRCSLMVKVTYPIENLYTRLPTSD